MTLDYRFKNILLSIPLAPLFVVISSSLILKSYNILKLDNRASQYFGKLFCTGPLNAGVLDSPIGESAETSPWKLSDSFTKAIHMLIAKKIIINSITFCIFFYFE